MPKLQKRNPNVWALYSKLLKFQNVIDTQTAWANGGWHAATPGEIQEAQKALERCREELKALLKNIPMTEISSWDVYNDLLALKLIAQPAAED